MNSCWACSSGRAIHILQPNCKCCDWKKLVLLSSPKWKGTHIQEKSFYILQMWAFWISQDLMASRNCVTTKNFSSMALKMVRQHLLLCALLFPSRGISAAVLRLWTLMSVQSKFKSCLPLFTCCVILNMLTDSLGFIFPTCKMEIINQPMGTISIEGLPMMFST